MAENRARLLQHRAEIAHEPQQHFARDGRRNRPAGVAVFFAIARERDLAAAADDQLVVAAAVVVALRRVAAKLHDAGGGVDFDRADRLHEIREPLGERFADSLQLGGVGGGQLRRRQAQLVERHGERIPLDDVAGKLARRIARRPPWPLRRCRCSKALVQTDC